MVVAPPADIGAAEAENGRRDRDDATEERECDADILAGVTVVAVERAAGLLRKLKLVEEAAL